MKEQQVVCFDMHIEMTTSCNVDASEVEVQQLSLQFEEIACDVFLDDENNVLNQDEMDGFWYRVYCEINNLKPSKKVVYIFRLDGEKILVTKLTKPVSSYIVITFLKDFINFLLLESTDENNDIDWIVTYVTEMQSLLSKYEGQNYLKLRKRCCR